MEDLHQEWSDLLVSSRARNTHAVYQQAWESFRKFLLLYFPASNTPYSYEQMALFISYLSLQGYAASTIVTYISGISCRLQTEGLLDVTKHFVVSRLLVGCRRRHSRTDVRCPITMPILKKLLSALPAVRNSYDAILFKACFLAAFWGFLRIGEFTANSRSTSDVSLEGRDVIVDGSAPRRHVRLHIRSSKTDQQGQGCYILMPEADGCPLCPVQAVLDYMAIRPQSSGAFFCRFDGNHVTRREFTAVLRKCLSFLDLPVARFTSHSFRIGAATSAAMAGFDSGEIQNMGRWSSDAHKRYVRINMLPIA